MPAWRLTTAEVSQLLRGAGLEPRLGSPFLAIEATEEVAEVALPGSPELLGALNRLARPDVVLSVLAHPPDEPTPSWLYGLEADERLALYQAAGAERHLLSWPVGGALLIEHLEAPLDLPEPAHTEDFSVCVDRCGFQALAAIVDLAQENTLLALLDRQGPPYPGFDPSSAVECYQRGLGTGDLRWMVPRARVVSPAPLSCAAGDVERGLETLIGNGSLTRRGKQCAPSPAFARACSLLGGCSGFSVLSTRRWGGQAAEEGAWTLSHVAAARGIQSLWLLEFSDVAAADFVVRVGDTTASALDARFQAGVLGGPASATNGAC